MRKLLALLPILLLGACASNPLAAPPAVADCVLADELQKKETVTPIPEDHDLTLAEVWDLLKNHLVEEKGIADRSNDKTNFVNNNCRGHANAQPANTK